MQKNIIWYSLLLKRTLKKRATWIILAVMCLLVWLIAGIVLPNQENVMVGILSDEGIYSSQITQLLENSESVFEFVEYQNKEQLQEDIACEKVICGFWYSEEFDEKVKNQNIDQVITFITTPSQSKAQVASETVYAAFLQVYSQIILTDSEQQIFAVHSEARMAEIMDRFQQYMDGTDIFQIKKEVLPGAADTLGKMKDTTTYRVQGMVGLMVLLVMFLSGTGGPGDRLSGVRQVLVRRERVVYDILSQLAAATPYAIAGLLLIIIGTHSRKPVIEILSMLVLLVYGSIWNMLARRFIHTETGLIAGIVMLVVINLTICPVVIDLGQYLPAMNYIRIIFPLGVYLL